jgi:protein TonB
VHPRVKRHFSYPKDAQRHDEQGTVTVRLSIDAQGSLLGATVAGSCPAASLCEAALVTAGEAAPYPAPPPALGGNVELLVRMQYVLER